MDIGYTYGGPSGWRIMIYAPPGLQPPEEIDLTGEETGQAMQFVRLSDRSLSCYKNDGGCGDYDCHRTQLGKCRCGAHKDVDGNYVGIRPTRARPDEKPEQQDPRPPIPKKKTSTRR